MHEQRCGIHKAAEQGYAFSQYSIGGLYTNGERVPQDYVQAMDYFFKDAKQGHAQSLQYQPFPRRRPRYSQGHTKPMEWDLKVANQGHRFSQYNVGVFYKHSRGVPRDYKQAMRWLLKAAQQENDVAQFNICLLYNNGQGVPQDYTKAAEWFSKGADQGHDDAKRELET